MIKRDITSVLERAASRKKIIVLIGARQVGKTTLLTDIISKYDNRIEFNCDEPDDRARLEDKSGTELKALLQGYDAVLIDECQRVRDIGMILKKIGDLKLDMKIFATGSSSLELAEGISESAAGRVFQYNLCPISMNELISSTSLITEQRQIERRMIYGFYPDAVTDPQFASTILKNLKERYLYKDILSYKGIRHPALVEKIVTMLSLQIGNEVNFNELGNALGADKETIENYINILEKCRIVFKLNSFSRNMRNEIKKGKKVYFYDTGIRNAVINNFSPLNLRNDTGALWENMMVAERLKYNANNDLNANLYFWRNKEGGEVDLVEERDGRIAAFEFKTGKTCKAPKSFSTAYPEASYSVITPQNFETFVC